MGDRGATATVRTMAICSKCHLVYRMGDRGATATQTVHRSDTRPIEFTGWEIGGQPQRTSIPDASRGRSEFTGWEIGGQPQRMPLPLLQAILEVYRMGDRGATATIASPCAFSRSTSSLPDGRSGGNRNPPLGIRLARNSSAVYRMGDRGATATHCPSISRDRAASVYRMGDRGATATTGTFGRHDSLRQFTGWEIGGQPQPTARQWEALMRRQFTGWEIGGQPQLN